MFVSGMTVNISSMKCKQQLGFFSHSEVVKHVSLSEQSHISSCEKPSSAESP